MEKMELTNLEEFYKGKRVLVTGHTGFKGTWLMHILNLWGAKVTGVALKPSTTPNLFDLSKTEDICDSRICDIRNLGELQSIFSEVQPEIVFHLAAQPIVRESYKEPVYTYETNVMGTVNLMECVRQTPSVISVVNITTDKVYLNVEREEGYREDEPLDGYDPYSNSKSCSELVTHSYVKSFFSDGKRDCAISTARAGNVIGGGDFSPDRIIPDCVRAALSGDKIYIRNPESVRPYQHVLEPLFSYLTIACEQARDKHKASAYNIGPDDRDTVTTGELVKIFCDCWGAGVEYEIRRQEGAPHEAKYLRLNCGKIKDTFGIVPVWNIQKAVSETAQFTKVYKDGGDIKAEMEREIKEYTEDFLK